MNGEFKKARFIRQKCYIEQFYHEEKYRKIKTIKEFNKKPRKLKLHKFCKIEITCAGMPKQCYDYVTWDNFKTGFTCGGKLTFKHVKRWCKISRNGLYY